MKKIVRLQYDSEGTSEFLGLPCKTITEYWNGEVSTDGVHIDDAFEVNEITLTDDHSTGLLGLAAKIAEVRLQARQVPTELSIPTVKALSLTTTGEADWESEITEVELTEVPVEEGLEVEGTPVWKVWKMPDDKSFIQITGAQATMDGRGTMEGYPIEGATECVYRVISGEQIPSEITGISTQEFQVDPVTGTSIGEEGALSEPGTFVVAEFAKNAMNGLCGLTLVNIAKGGGVDEWMIRAWLEYGIPFKNLMTAYEIDPNIKYNFDGNELLHYWLVGSTSLELSNLTMVQGNRYEVLVKDAVTPNRSIFGASSSSLNSLCMRNDDYSLKYYTNETVWVDRFVNFKYDGEIYKIVLTPELCTINGNEMGTYSAGGTVTGTSGSLKLFYGFNGSEPCSIGYLSAVETSGSRHFYTPFTQGENYGMYDLFTNEFFGSNKFTCKLE